MLTAACYPVSQFISCKTNLKCHWKLKKKKKGKIVVWSDLYFLDKLFLALWLSSHWLPFPALPASPVAILIIVVHVINILNKWDNPSIWPDFKNVFTVWFRNTTMMALKVRRLFTHRPVKVKSSQSVTAHWSINSQRLYNRIKRNNKNKRQN